VKLRNHKSRPFVFINVAISADGKLATANRAVTSVGSSRDLAHLYELRATADAIMSGARTIEEADATLRDGGQKYRRTRVRRGLREHAVRVIVSGRGSISTEARIFRKTSPAPLLILTTKHVGATRLKRLAKLADEVRAAGKREVDWPLALNWLRRRHGVRRLLCEGGGGVNDSLFRAGVVDELHVTICPWLIGGRAAPTVADGLGFEHLAEAAQFRLSSSRHVGDELFLVYQRASSNRRPNHRPRRTGPGAPPATRFSQTLS
jgi:riboflavin-specific deaminase-like protein